MLALHPGTVAVPAPSPPRLLTVTDAAKPLTVPKASTPPATGSRYRLSTSLLQRGRHGRPCPRPARRPQPEMTTATPRTAAADTLAEVKSGVALPEASRVPVTWPSEALAAPYSVTLNALLAQPTALVTGAVVTW